MSRHARVTIVTLERYLIHLEDSDLIVFVYSGPQFSGVDWQGMTWLEDPAWLDGSAAGTSTSPFSRSLEDLPGRVEELDRRRWTVDVHLCEPDSDR